MNQAEIDGIHAALSDADANGDAEALAAIAWRLYGELDAATRPCCGRHPDMPERPA
jgi:hypothetical protein